MSALVTFFQRVGLTAADVGIRVSTRALLGAVLDHHGVDHALFPSVYVVVDKAEKLPVAEVAAQLAALGIPIAATEALLRVLGLRDVAGLERLLPSTATPHFLAELQRLFALCEAYGLRDWVQFDASVVRGLAYYTGPVFEVFDRAGSLRAVCGGGRYDDLLSSLGGGPRRPCVGFGFGDAVIVELLKDRGLLPDLPRSVDDVVFALEPALHGAACGAAAALRAAGRRVDLVLEPKRLKWALKVRKKSVGWVLSCGGQERHLS